MKTTAPTIYEEITLYHTDKEHDKADCFILEGGWKIRHAGPIIRNHRVSMNRFKIVAYRRISVTTLAESKFRMPRRDPFNGQVQP